MVGPGGVALRVDEGTNDGTMELGREMFCLGEMANGVALKMMRCD